MKKTIAFIFGIVFVGVIGFALFSIRAISTASQTVDINTNPVFIIDPGHGGMDGGAVGVDQIIEKDINLKIALFLKDILTINGYDVVMTREDDRSIHDESINSIKKQKTSDLNNRLKLTKEYPNGVFISIHQNKFGQSSSHGAQIFYGSKNAESKFLASILQRNFVESLQPENTRETKKAGKDLFLMYYAEIPAVLVECGFISNYQEAQKLITDDYQKQVAFTIFSGLLEFLGNKYSVDVE